MKLSTFVLQDGEVWEINSSNYHTSLVQYTNWSFIKEEESLTLISRIHYSWILETFQYIAVQQKVPPNTCTTFPYLAARQ